jgi:phosphoribosyl-dephospho-CoA transferase
MISKISLRMCSGELTKDDRDNNDLDVLCTGFVGVSRKIGDVQAQGCVVAQDSVEICKRTLVRGKR